MSFYTRYGPFNNGGSPGINKTFLDGVENALVSLSDGTGTPSVARVALPVGGLSRITRIQAQGAGTFNHGLGTTPDAMSIHSLTDSGPVTVNCRLYTATQFTVLLSDTGTTWEAIAFKF